MNFDLTYRKFGARAILINWANVISEKTLEEIILINDQIETELQDDIWETVIAYNSLTVLLRNGDDWKMVVEKIKKLRAQKAGLEKREKKTWQIPVCYSQEFGIDLEEMSRALNLTKQEIIDIHCQASYTLHFIGFLPGFMYLGGLDTRIHCARKSEPRWMIEKGAVGIGGKQTGIYPKSSPAGWNILGNSPIELFDVTQTVPCFASPGDQVRFKSILYDEHVDLSHDVKFGRFDPESLKI